MFQLVGHDALAEPLAEQVASGKKRPVLLRPGADTEGMPFDERWCLLINEKVEPDL